MVDDDAVAAAYKQKSMTVFALVEIRTNERTRRKGQRKNEGDRETERIRERK